MSLKTQPKDPLLSAMVAEIMTRSEQLQIEQQRLKEEQAQLHALKLDAIQYMENLSNNGQAHYE